MNRDAFLREFLMRRNRTKEVAGVLRISAAAVSSWHSVPSRHAHALSDAFDVPLWEIRPDLWEPPVSEAAHE